MHGNLANALPYFQEEFPDIFPDKRQEINSEMISHGALEIICEVIPEGSLKKKQPKRNPEERFQ